MRLTSPDRSSALTTAPRMAMPVTAPNSRLVFVADAAIPDRSAGTAVSTDEGTGTTQVPMPTPAKPSAAASGREAGVGVITPVGSRTPGGESREPATPRQRGPPRVVQPPPRGPR